MLQISVYGVPGMHAPPITVRVSQKGTVIMPLLGEVEVGGLTAEELSIKLDELFRAGYLADPQVTVFVSQRAESTKTRVSILGAITSPGNYEIAGNVNLVDAIVMAGGASKPASGEFPNLSSIKVIRQVDGEEVVLYVNLETEGRDFMVKPNDIIIVEEYGGVIVLGNVVQPGAVRIYSNFSLANAIQFAGGALPNANLEEVKVIRREKNEAGEEVDKTYVLNYMNEGPFFIMQKQDRVVVDPCGAFAIYGEVKTPGNYYISKDLTVMDAVHLAGGFTEFASKNNIKVVRFTEGKKEIIKVPAAHIIRTGNRAKDVLLKDGDTVVVPESWF